MKKFMLYVIALVLFMPMVVSAHRVTFETYGGTHFDGLDKIHGDVVDLDAYEPELEGYIFDGWSNCPELHDYDCQVYGTQTITEDTTFYARFEANYTTRVYNLTTGEVDNFAGIVIGYDNTSQYGNWNPGGRFFLGDDWTEKVLEATPMRGYIFVGWYVESHNPETYEDVWMFDGVSFEEASFESSKMVLAGADRPGLTTYYAVFKEDPNSITINEVHATIPEPKGNANFSEEISSDEPNKYTVIGDTDGISSWSTDNLIYDYAPGCGMKWGRGYYFRAIAKPKAGYRITKDTKYYINGVSAEDYVDYPAIVDGEYLYNFDVLFHIDVPGTLYTLDLDYNGGRDKNFTGTDVQILQTELTVNAQTFLNGLVECMTTVNPPSGYAFDGVEIDGVKYEIGSKITVDRDMDIKYLWKEVKQTYTVVIDYNGGKRNGKSTETIVLDDNDYPLDKANFTDGLVPPAGKELDYILVNGKKELFGIWYSLSTNNTVKYIWRNIPNPNLNGFKVAGGNTTSIKLSWNKTDTATGYYVYQSTDNKKWTKIATTNASTLYYTKTGLTANKKYYYKVEAYKGSTKLVTSKVVTTKTAPKAPTFKVKTYNYNSVTFTVGKSKGAKKFVIEKSTDNNTFTTAKTVTKAGKVVVSGLDTGTYYLFRVKVCNEYGICSGYSKVVGRKLELKRPTIKVSSKAKTKMTIKVPAVAGASGYVIERSTSKSSGYTMIADVSSAKTYTDTGLTSKTKYFYRVKAYRVVNGKKVYSPTSKVASAKAK